MLVSKIVIWSFKNFCSTTLNRNLVIGNFPVTIRMFVSFPLWVFGLEVWNDHYALRVGFGAWHRVHVSCPRILYIYGNGKIWHLKPIMNINLEIETQTHDLDVPKLNIFNENVETTIVAIKLIYPKVFHSITRFINPSKIEKWTSVEDD